MTVPRAYSPDECRQIIINQWRAIAHYWAELAAAGHSHPFEGLVFSILAEIDGDGTAHPRLRLITDPHPDDESFHRNEGENWWPADCDLTEGVALHEQFYKDASTRMR
jgi:hypothetical protein